MIIPIHFALDSETFNLLKSKKKSDPLGILSGSEDVYEIITMGASWPWKLSIVPICEYGGKCSLSKLTCALNGLITNKSLFYNFASIFGF